MGKLNYLDITYIKITNKNIYINLNKNIHITEKTLKDVQNKK